MSEKTHVVWHEHHVSRADRERLNRQRGTVIWFTGLSGCGKSTIANRVDQRLYELQARSFVLDGDNIRHGLNASPELLADRGTDYAQRFGLGFAADDRQENIRRIAAVAQLFVSAGMITLTAFVSPYRRDRDAARRLIETAGQPGDFVEAFVDAPLEVCESRDPKGLYQKARAGEIRNFTGIDDPFEPPLAPELHLPSATRTADQLADQVIDYLKAQGRLG